MKYITFSIFLFSLILLRPYTIQNHGMMYVGDDESYMGHATALAFGKFPDYTQEGVRTNGAMPGHSMGAGIMSAPFVFLFSLVDRATGNSIVEKRTLENVRDSWSGFGYVVGTQFYFWLACLLLFSSARIYQRESIAAATVILMIICQGIPLYALRRPFFAHIPEFFLQSVCVFWLCRGSFLKPAGKAKTTLLGVVLSLMTLVRYNNILSALVWPCALFGTYESPRRRWWRDGLRALPVFFLIGLGLLLFKIYPSWANDFYAMKDNYDSATIDLLLNFREPFYYVKRTFWIFLGYDWGLVFTAPFVLVGFVYALWKREMPLRWPLLLMALPAWANFYIVLVWGTQGSWYGYRYLLFMLYPLALLPFSFFVGDLVQRFGARRALVGLGLVAIVPAISMFSFEGNGQNLTLFAYPASEGGGWRNETFQLEVWKTVVQPLGFLRVMSKGILHYIVYVPLALTGNEAYLPEDIRLKYPVFSGLTLLKTLLMYGLPFLFHWATVKLFPGAMAKK